MPWCKEVGDFSWDIVYLKGRHTCFCYYNKICRFLDNRSILEFLIATIMGFVKLIRCKILFLLASLLCFAHIHLDCSAESFLFLIILFESLLKLPSWVIFLLDIYSNLIWIFGFFLAKILTIDNWFSMGCLEQVIWTILIKNTVVLNGFIVLLVEYCSLLVSWFLWCWSSL